MLSSKKIIKRASNLYRSMGGDCSLQSRQVLCTIRALTEAVNAELQKYEIKKPEAVKKPVRDRYDLARDLQSNQSDNFFP